MWTSSTNEVTSKIRNQDYKIEKLSFHLIIDFTFESHILKSLRTNVIRDKTERTETKDLSFPNRTHLADWRKTKGWDS